MAIFFTAIKKPPQRYVPFFIVQPFFIKLTGRVVETALQPPIPPRIISKNMLREHRLQSYEILRAHTYTINLKQLSLFPPWIIDNFNLAGISDT